jgi:hypothetical protein
MHVNKALGPYYWADNMCLRTVTSQLYCITLPLSPPSRDEIYKQGKMLRLITKLQFLPYISSALCIPFVSPLLALYLLFLSHAQSLKIKK